MLPALESQTVRTMKGGIPEDVERFVVQHISSTEQLEVLLLVAGQPERAWTAATVYAEIKTNQDSIESHLKEFARRGFLTASAQSACAYQLVASQQRWKEVLPRLATLYRQQMHRVIELIYSKPSPAVQSFAEAFRFRKN